MDFPQLKINTNIDNHIKPLWIKPLIKEEIYNLENKKKIKSCEGYLYPNFPIKNRITKVIYYTNLLKSFGYKNNFDNKECSFIFKNIKKNIKKINEINNPHLVKIHNINFYSKDKTLLTLEAHLEQDYIRGETLNNYLKKNIELTELLSIIIQTISVLLNLHNNKIYLNDLNPSNIIIENSNKCLEKIIKYDDKIFKFKFSKNISKVNIIDYTLATYKHYRNQSYDCYIIKNQKECDKSLYLDVSFFLLGLLKFSSKYKEIILELIDYLCIFTSINIYDRFNIHIKDNINFVYFLNLIRKHYLKRKSDSI